MGPEIGRLPWGELRQHSHQDALTANAQMPLKRVQEIKNSKKKNWSTFPSHQNIPKVDFLFFQKRLIRLCCSYSSFSSMRGYIGSIFGEMSAVRPKCIIDTNILFYYRVKNIREQNSPVLIFFIFSQFDSQPCTLWRHFLHCLESWKSDGSG